MEVSGFETKTYAEAQQAPFAERMREVEELLDEEHGRCYLWRIGKAKLRRSIVYRYVSAWKSSRNISSIIAGALNPPSQSAFASSKVLKDICTHQINVK